MDESETIRKAGWRQGSFLAPASIQGTVRFCRSLDPAQGSWFMVVAQDCDLINGDFDAEPVAELLLCQPAQVGQPAWKYGKDPRRLQFEVTHREEPLLLNAFPSDRAFVDRISLTGLTPEATLTASSATVRLVTQWLAKRYSRPAFPDNFNRCLRPVEKKIVTILKANTKYIDQIFLRVDPADEELDGDEPYTVMFWLVMKDDLWRNEVNKRQSAIAVEKLKALFLDAEGKHLVAGVQLLACVLKSESQVSLDDVRELKPWNYDYITHRDESAGP